MSANVKIQELQNGTFIATVPKALVQALGWKKSTTIEWTLEEGRLYVKKSK